MAEEQADLIISEEPRIVMVSYMFDNDKAYTRLFVESARLLWD